MTIKETLALRDKLQADILALVTEFEKETEVRVSGIKVDRVALFAMGTTVKKTSLLANDAIRVKLGID